MWFMQLISRHWIAGLILLAVAGQLVVQLDAAPPDEKPAAADGGNIRTAAPRIDLYGDPLPVGAIARLGTVRWRHGAYVSTVAFSPNGKQLLTHGHNGVCIWDVATGKEVRSLRDTWMGSAAVSADGKFVITAENPSNRPLVRFRKWSDLTIEREFSVDPFNLTRFSPDGKLLAIAPRQGEIHVLDLTSGRKLQSYGSYQGVPRCLIFSDESKTLVTCDSQVVRLWDVETGKKKQEIVTPSIAWKALVSRDGTLLASLGMTEERISPTGRVYHSENTIRIWDIASGKELRQIGDQKKGLDLLAFAPDGKALITAGRDGLSFWDSATGKNQRRLDIGKEHPTAIGFSPDGKILALGSDATRLIDLASGKDLIKPAGPQSVLSSAGFVLDGRTAFTTSGNQTIHLWNPLTGAELGSFEGIEEWAGNMTFIDKGRFLIAKGPDQTIRIYDLTAKKEIRRFKVPPDHDRVQALSPDGQFLAFTGKGNGVALVNLKSGQETRLLQEDEVRITGIAFGPEGKTLMVWFSDHTIQIWDLATKKNLKRFALGYGSAIRPSWAAAERRDIIWPYVAFISPDGRYFAYIQHRSFILHELPSLRLIRRSEEYPCDISLVAFSPDGRMIAWASHDRVIHLLETASGKERHVLSGHLGGIFSLAFSSDGRLLISGSGDTTGLVWDVMGKLGADEKWGGALSTKDLDSCWSDLAGEDVAKAYQTIRRLVTSQAQAVPMLTKRLKPIPAVDQKRLAKLVADLDSDQFIIRKAAERELEDLGELVAPICQKAMEGKPSTEMRRRLATLIDRQTKAELNLSPDRLRAVRALEILEHIGSVEARELLTQLARGADEALLTREAKMSLSRLIK
jgi:WD40 repeat protein